MALNDQELESWLRRALAGTSEQAPRPQMTRMAESRQVREWLESQLSGLLRPASVLVPLVRRPEGLTVLLTRRADHLRSHQGQVSFPGGRREPEDASAAAAALREAWEEVGLPQEAVEVFGYLDDYPTVSRFLVTPVVGFVEDVAEWRHDPNEVAQVFEVPLRFLMAPGRFERRLMSNNGVQFPVLQIHYEGQRIWGATAAMLRELITRLETTT